MINKKEAVRLFGQPFLSTHKKFLLVKMEGIKARNDDHTQTTRL